MTCNDIGVLIVAIYNKIVTNLINKYPLHNIFNGQFKLRLRESILMMHSLDECHIWYISDDYKILIGVYVVWGDSFYGEKVVSSEVGRSKCLTIDKGKLNPCGH